MRRHFILLVVLFVLGATAVQAQTSTESAPISFSISSIKSPFALAGTFQGEYRIRDDSMEITVSSAEVYLRAYGTYAGRRELTFINIGLATLKDSGKWTIINHATAIPVGETMRPGDKYLADKMRFSIKKDSALDLTKCWLVVEMGELSLDSNEEDKVGYAFAQSDRNIFAPLVVRAAIK